jgi:pantoate--beta-alanine ligase
MRTWTNIRALRAASELIASSETSSAKLLIKMRSVMAEEPNARLDYVLVVSPDTLEEIDDVRGGGLLAIAAAFGTTRLIDNMLVQAGPP